MTAISIAVYAAPIHSSLTAVVYSHFGTDTVSSCTLSSAPCKPLATTRMT